MECGRDVEGEDELRGGLCVDCLLERTELVRLPEVVDLVRCPECGSVSGRGGWGPHRTPGTGDEELDASLAARAAEEAVGLVDGARVMSLGLDVRRETKATYAVDLDIEVDLMGRTVPLTRRTRVRVKGEMCPPCSRRAGQYYEAVIQLRGTRERPATAVELERARAYVLEEVDRLSAHSRDVAILKVDEVHGGLDFYLTNQSAAAQLAKGLSGLFSTSTTSSTTMAGRRDGKDLVRVTHLVRMPDLRRGDYVLVRDRLLRVLSATPKSIAVEETAGEGKRRHLGRADMDRITFVGDAACPEEAVLVSATGSEVQVLDPVTLRTVDVQIPDGFQTEGRETLRVVRAGDLLLLVD